MRTILHFFRVHASPRTVFENLTTKKGLTGWWSTRAEVTPGVGGVIRFTFLQGFNPEMRVEALEPDRLVKWTCIAGHENWQDNTFSFEIRARGDGEADVMFRQDYARELSDEVYGNYNFNWGYYLDSLKKFSERGLGTPYSPH